MNRKNYAVITADVMDSRKVASFRSKRDSSLEELSRLHLERKLILSPYAITAWDEFQAVLSRPEYISHVILDLRRLFYPLRLWVAVGLGAASGVHAPPVNIHGGGEAFELARKAAEQLKLGSPKFRVLTLFESGSETFNTIANTIYRLHDSLLDGTTDKQWATINMQLETGRQEMTAKRLNLDISTISRNLKRSYYWHFIETAVAMEQIVQAYFKTAH